MCSFSQEDDGPPLFDAGALNAGGLDDERQIGAEKAEFDFRTRHISVAGISNDILERIHKFPLPMQRIVADEATAVVARLEKGKLPPCLTSAKCHCLFFHRYLLPCRHIFHEHIYGENRLLTEEVWRNFQLMFEETGFEVYEHRERVEVAEPLQTEAEREAEARRLAINELMERVRDRFWIEEGDDANASLAFIKHLSALLDPVLNKD